MADRDHDHQAGGDDERDLERVLKRHGRKAEIGDLEDNRNVSGSTTWQNSADQRDVHPQHARKGQAQSPVEETHNEPPKKKQGH